jgi:hypothetical protein
VNKVFAIVEKFFASLFGQSLVLAEVIHSKIPDQDATRSFVIFLATKRPSQIEVPKSDCPSPMPTLSFDKCKATKPIVNVKPILDFEFFPVPLGDFDGTHLSCKITGLSPESAVELWQDPKEPI